MLVLRKPLFWLAFVLCTNTAFADVWVNGYQRSDGTSVQGHYRSSPNSTVTDNYSFNGNIRPYSPNLDRHEDHRPHFYLNKGADDL